METRQTQYHNETPKQVRDILEKYLHSRKRLRLFYGDNKTGLDWNEEWQTQGYIGRSTGEKPIVILLENSTSSGGGAILDHCIVKITLNKTTLYQHPKYHTRKFTQHNNYVFRSGKQHAKFETPLQAKKFIAFITGERNNKS